MLLAFDGSLDEVEALRLCGWSEGAFERLRLETTAAFTLDTTLTALGLAPDVVDLAAEALRTARDGSAAALSVEGRLGGAEGQACDVVVHLHDGRLIIEYEPRAMGMAELASFALQANRAVQRLRRSNDVNGLLTQAVQAVRALTGYDRVMAYRFRADDSGDVVAEDCTSDLPPYLGRRYPASDIPAQARRLYTLNTLRLIADVAYEPAALLGRAGDRPLDLSHAVLRSVSPIHLEYLANMGVRASMSVSIVVRGRLWGLIACHHRQPAPVPHGVRMACDVMAQVIATRVESLEQQIEEQRSRGCAELTAELSTQLARPLLEDDGGGHPLQGLLAQRLPRIAALVDADAACVVKGAQIDATRELPAGLVAATVGQLQAQGDDLVLRERRDHWPTEAPDPGSWVGLMALCCDRTEGLWLLMWRLEQVETIRWGGEPDKQITIGPLGPRLTPRGSFEEWRETVRDRAEPWAPGMRQCAREFLHAMQRLMHGRLAELERTRSTLLAMLGHDLRDPLNNISLAARLVGRHGDPSQLGETIRRSSGRMQRLIAQVLDLSRIRGSGTLGVQPRPGDLSALLTDLIHEADLDTSALPLDARITPGLWAAFDADRFAQLLSNLIGNARHHGLQDRPVRIRLDALDDAVTGAPLLRLQVANASPPIPPQIATRLFAPFKASSEPGAGSGRVNRHQGLGLGLYIAHQIAREHGSTLAYRYDDTAGEVCMELYLPPAPAPTCAR